MKKDHDLSDIPPPPDGVPGDLPVSLTLTIDQINQALVIIAERPLKDVLHLYLAMRNQGDMAVRLFLQPKQEGQS